MGAKQTTLQFAALLPPGQYQFTALGSTSGSMSTESKIDGALPTFEVTSGGVIDLGLLVVQPTGGGKAVVLPVDEATPVEEVLQTYFPDKMTAWSGKTVTRWPGIASWTAKPFTYASFTMAASIRRECRAIGCWSAPSTETNRERRGVWWRECLTSADWLHPLK